jgi:hypothetical protein
VWHVALCFRKGWDIYCSVESALCKRGEHIQDYVGEGYDDRLHPVIITFRPVVSSDQPILQWKARPASTPTLPNNHTGLCQNSISTRTQLHVNLPPPIVTHFWSSLHRRLMYCSPSPRLIWTRIIASLVQGVLEKERKSKPTRLLMYLFRRYQSIALVSSFLCNSYSEVCISLPCFQDGVTLGVWYSVFWNSVFGVSSCVSFGEVLSRAILACCEVIC